MENWTLTWTKLTQLNKNVVEALKNDLPGVYRFSYKSDDGNYYVFYVGQTENIKQRLLEHLSENGEDICIESYLKTKSCFFRYAKITKKYVRDAAERQMYKQYEPDCNDIEPEGSDNIKVNLS